MVAHNEDRIAKWRERREAERVARETHGDLPTELALLATRAEALSTGSSEDPEPILALVSEGLRRLPSDSIADRRALFDAAARGVERGIDKADPHSDYAELRRRQLRTIIRLIEGDARAGLAIAAPGYRPTGLEDALEPLLKGYQRRRKITDETLASEARRQAVLAGEAYTIAVPADEEADLMFLRERIALLDATSGPRTARRDRPDLLAVLALLNYQFVQLRSESRLALAWTLIGPAVLMGLLSIGYLLTGIHSILNMDVPTFAMIGATAWFMLRNVIFRTTATYLSQRSMLTFRAFNPALIGIAEGLIYMFSYVPVYLCLIIVGHIAGLFTLPDNVPAVVFWIVCIGLTGLAIGTIFGSISVVWPYFPRFAPVIERSLQIVSSVVLVTEQLPTEYRPYLLWSPLAHAMQLLRSAYFEGYKSEDAVPHYFFIGFGVLVIAAVVAQWSVRPRSVPL